jgi:uncharacterized protein YndB with AHSA1/START domain
MTERRAQAMHTERSVRLAASPPMVWRTLQQVDRYRAWWPWLRAFDARSLEAGDSWACTVQPPAPYRVTFTIDLVEVVDAEAVVAAIDGDVAGTARIDLVAGDGETELRLTADLQAARPWLQRVERWARPIARFGHDRVIDRALAQLSRQIP